MIMKQKVLAMSVAAALAGGVAGSASAALAVVEGGVGHMLMVPYFTTQGGNATLLSIINTDTVRGKAVKIRFRSGVDSDDIFDFQVFLSPGDVWTAALSASGTGPSALATSDKSCTLPASVNANFITSRLASFTDTNGVVHDTNEQTREGYAEIFNTADIPPTLPGGTTNPLFTSIKHVSGTPPCTSTTLLGIEARALAGAWNPQAFGVAGQELAPPTGTLMGNWTNINVPSTLTFTGAMPAIVATGATNIVYSGQTAVQVAATPSPIGGGTASYFPNVNQTADGVLVNQANTGVITAKYDFPDMSTPYEVATISPIAQSQNLSVAYIRAGVINEFFTDPALQGATDWTLSMSTKRYHVSGRGAKYNTAAGWTVAQLIHGVAGGVTLPFPSADVTYATNGRSSCVATGSAPVWWDREELTSGPTGAVISPGAPTLYSLCGEVNVLAWNGTGATTPTLKATLIVANSAAGTNNGWARVNLISANNVAGGLPVIGNSYEKAVNTAVSAGISGNYGLTFPHRYR